MFTVSKAFAGKRHVSIDLHGLKIKDAKAAVISKIKFLAEMQSDAEKTSFLQAYAQTYLKEEIWLEQFIRKIDPFRKFLEVSA